MINYATEDLPSTYHKLVCSLECSTKSRLGVAGRGMGIRQRGEEVLHQAAALVQVHQQVLRVGNEHVLHFTHLKHLHVLLVCNGRDEGCVRGGGGGAVEV